MEGSSESCLAVVVPKLLVKRAKDALEAQGRLDKNVKIKPVSAQTRFQIIDGDLQKVQEGTFFLPLSRKSKDQYSSESLSKIINFIGMRECIASICLVRMPLPADAKGNDPRTNLLVSTIARWIHRTTSSLGINRSSCSTSKLLSSYNWTYMVYQPLLLLAPTLVSNLASVLGSLDMPDEFSSLYPLLCESFKVTHIALNALIPENILIKRTAADPYNRGKYQQLHEDECDHSPNILRSPTGLTPLYGDFGLNLGPDHAPFADNFSSAFWCNAQQNGIFQTWAPRYSMFSRGNISEKARILQLDSLTEATLRAEPQKTSAVDLYAGIGYFAFSYAKAGVGKVLCWEINPWSVEGLRRGARKNKWTVRTVEDGETYDGLAGDERLVVFEEDNEHAVSRVNNIRFTIPPVRHVNCGLLPSSKDSWKIAVHVLDETMRGWVHIHENITKDHIETRKDEIVGIFTELVEKYCDRKLGHRREVECEHVQQVKSYAPGVMHCVLDIAIWPNS